ncbi:MAG: type VI secretion system membrane subunit TssM, partial [Betaproteobacteria bacterium]|nr:type VI secretion system membrane subunit TssM [Betaproteobacteria bacterium]
MLHDPDHYSAKSLRDLILADWSSLPRDVTVEQHEQLEQHLDALLGRGIVTSPTPMDQNLVRDVRAQLLRMSLAQRVYSRIKNFAANPGDIPDFSITRADVAGPSASLAFARASGQPLTKGVSWLYTYRGYHEAFEKQVDAASVQLASEEGWVLGVPAQQRTFNPKDPASALRLNDEVKRLYLEDYARIWDAFINDIRLVNQTNLQQSIQVARILSAPTSPLPTLLRAIVKEVTLGEKFGGDRIDKAVEKARDTVQGTRESLAAMLSGNRPQAAAPAPQRIESIVDDRFANLRAYVKAPAPGQPAPVDQSVQLLGELYTLMTATETAVRGGAAPPQSDVQNKVRAEAGRLPEPARSLLNTLVSAGVTQALTATRDNLSANIGATIGDFCNTAIAGRYPFNRNSSRDVTQDDFARMFSPGGLMDDFFQKNLIQFVDTSTKPWSFRQVGGGQMGAQGDTGSLIQFQRAQAIRDTFFRNGGKTPSLRLDFKPIEMDASITQFILDVDGQIVKYAHGPTIPMSVTWPGTAGRSLVNIQVSPATGDQSGQRFEGPWALFRLFDRAQMEGLGQPERFRVTFNVDGRKATFEVTTSSVQNPFKMSDLSNFSCPSKL